MQNLKRVKMQKKWKVSKNVLRGTIYAETSNRFKNYGWKLMVTSLF